MYHPRLLALDSAGNLYVADGPKPIGSQESVYVLSIFPPGKSESMDAIEIGSPRALLFAQGLVYLACAPKRSNENNPDGWVKVYRPSLGFPTSDYHKRRSNAGLTGS